MPQHPKMASVMAENGTGTDLVNVSLTLLEKIKQQIK
jgi:hypothetical protein